MSEQTLQLKVVENSTSAIAALGNLVNALERVKKAVSKGLSLNNAAQQFVSFSSAIEKGVSTKTVSTVERLASACERVKKSSKFDFSGLQNAAKVPELEGIKESMQTVVPSGLEKVAPEMQRVNQVLEETAPAAKEAAEGVKETGKAIKEAAKEAKHSHSILDKFFSSIGRIAFYRAIRSAIKAVTDGLKEGVSNVKKYSDAIGGSFAKDMNAASASLATMRNSLGAAVAPALQMLIPILSNIASFAITAFNALNQLFSLLRGGGSWTRATANMNDYTKAAKGAGGATKDLLADWDELNIIQSQGGGGGGGSDIDYSDMFEEVYEFDIDFERGIITVSKQLSRPRRKGDVYCFTSLKNGKTRTIKPAPSIMALLKEHRKHQAEMRLLAGSLWDDGGFPDLVFTTEMGGHLCYAVVERHFKKALAEAGIDVRNFHTLRHSYAVSSLRAGDDVKTVQENLGHYSAAFTLDVYGHVTDTMRDISSQNMERFIAGLK